MKLPRDLSGAGLAKALRNLGYEITRQSGSHLRLTTRSQGEQGKSRSLTPIPGEGGRDWV